MAADEEKVTEESTNEAKAEAKTETEETAKEETAKEETTATEKKVTVIDDSARIAEAESLCKWAAARAGAIIVLPGLGTMSLIANDIYMIMKLGKVFEVKIGEKAAISLLSSCGTVFVGKRLATLIPFAPLQIPIAIGTTYSLGKVVTEWLRAGQPKDLSAFKKVYDEASAEVKKNMDAFKNNPDKDKPLGDESKEYDVK